MTEEENNRILADLETIEKYESYLADTWKAKMRAVLEEQYVAPRKIGITKKIRIWLQKIIQKVQIAG